MKDLPRGLKIATVWLLAGLAVFAGVSAWQRQAAATRFEVVDGTIEIRRGPDGHYHWPGSVQGRRVDFLIDTGATTTAISDELATALGLPVLGRIVAQTANGRTEGTLVAVDVALDGGVQVQRLRVAALPGLDGRPLLGMDVLGRLRWQQERGVLRIQGPRGAVQAP